jgi:hypothetical protein
VFGIAAGSLGRERTDWAIGAGARAIHPSHEGSLSALRGCWHRVGTESSGFDGYRRCVEEAHAVLERLNRIEELDRRGAPAPELLQELRALVGEAERWARREGDDRALEAAAACEAAVLDQVR